MARLTPQEYAQKLAQRTSAATQDYVAGIQRVQQAPGQQAAKAAQKAAANYQARITDGSWAAAVNVPLADWQQQSINVGAPRLASGIQAAVPKIERVAAQLLPAVDAAAAKANAMPKNSLQDSIARATTFMTEMAKFKSRSRR